MVKVSFKLRWFGVILALIFVAMAVYGILRDEVTEVLNNARIICLSCIGIE